MKKVCLLVAVFCGILSLSAENLPITGWKTNVMQGKFTFQCKEYPIQIKCTEATAGRAVKEVGVWGRIHRVETLEAGKKYEIKVTYKLIDSPNGVVAVWVRGGGQFNLFGRASAANKTLRRQFTATGDKASIFVNLKEGTGELEVVSVELNKLD
jgi:hypothetical protein